MLSAHVYFIRWFPVSSLPVVWWRPTPAWLSTESLPGEVARAWLSLPLTPLSCICIVVFIIVYKLWFSVRIIFFSCWFSQEPHQQGSWHQAGINVPLWRWHHYWSIWGGGKVRRVSEDDWNTAEGSRQDSIFCTT